MTASNYHVLRLVLIFILAASSIANWRIYSRYARAHLPETSAWAMIKRLRGEGNPDGTRMMLGSIAAMLAGIGLVVLNVR
ncbi:hypothetical protein IM816_10030 [Luteibacter flocculans]|uniref:Uncharacterized protein n=1 Tax=Luteibacter flocculans TaxID=2780091 RepID=A0ABY4SY66_9GAMM|nr:hypothetical protein [Luteibacter flocculans]URL57004.1 hypothetical protein IM816_10030 [Luteibacter flocculans]